jgi:4-amino-4-deoxy-L-arabinose transferase-like glycosyltransferase
VSAPAANPGRTAALLCAALALCAAATFWVAEGVAPWSGDLHNAWHQYEYLAEGFARGHTYLSVDPDPALLALRDPYDPDANAATRLWDASLYRGRYYLYYGPAPAVALMLPWRLATGRALPQRLAVAVFACTGLAALALLIWEVRRRHFPALGPAALAAVLIVAFHAAWLPVILRRPSFWELPIVCAAACLWWALYFLWKFHDSGGRARWAVAAGAALALLMGSRATFVFAAVAVAALCLLRTAPARRGIRLCGLAAAALAFAGGAGLLLYNHARFGRWLEFGQSYQLWGTSERHAEHFSLAYAAFNARLYLLSPPSLGPYFPFLHPAWPEAFPRGYIAIEEMYGVAFMMPVHLAGLWALAWAWRGRRAPGGGPARVLLAGAAAASVFSGLTLACYAGACSRYIAELVAGWTVVTAVGLMAVFGSGTAGRVTRAAAAAAALWTVACVWLASAEFRGFMRLTSPRVYASLAHVLDYPSQWWARGHGIRYGPVDLVVRVPPSGAGTQTVLLASGRPERANQLVLTALGDGRVRLTLADNQHAVLETPPLEAPGGRLRVRIQAPWLYPPPEHPYWDGVGNPDARGNLQRLFAIEWAAGGVRASSALSSDPTGFLPAVRGYSAEEGRAPWVESLSQAAQP